jgi:hypothetical protein
MPLSHYPSCAFARAAAVLISACLLTSCIGPAGTTRFSHNRPLSECAVLISETEAQQLMAAQLERAGLHYPKDNHPKLVPGWYWRVVVQDRVRSPSRQMTNDYPSQIISKRMAESTALRTFKNRFGQDGVRLQPTQFIEGYFWRFLIASDTPDAGIEQTISARDGTEIFCR